jgi:CRISPR-associated protein Csm2
MPDHPSQRERGRGHREGPQRGPVGTVAGRPFATLFDPAKEDRALLDTLAYEQADLLPNINSSQLRKFFGELKTLYRRFDGLTMSNASEEPQALYTRLIEPQFKMLRSKVSYATRAAGQSKLDPAYEQFFSAGVSRSNNASDFRRFVLHVEAVVGFLYGMGKVKDKGGSQ